MVLLMEQGNSLVEVGCGVVSDWGVEDLPVSKFKTQDTTDFLVVSLVELGPYFSPSCNVDWWSNSLSINSIVPWSIKKLVAKKSFQEIMAKTKADVEEFETINDFNSSLGHGYDKASSSRPHNVDTTSSTSIDRDFDQPDITSQPPSPEHGTVPLVLDVMAASNKELKETVEALGKDLETAKKNLVESQAKADSWQKKYQSLYIFVNSSISSIESQAAKMRNFVNVGTAGNTASDEKSVDPLQLRMVIRGKTIVATAEETKMLQSSYGNQAMMKYLSLVGPYFGFIFQQVSYQMPGGRVKDRTNLTSSDVAFFSKYAIENMQHFHNLYASPKPSNVNNQSPVTPPVVVVNSKSKKKTIDDYIGVALRMLHSSRTSVKDEFDDESESGDKKR